MVPLGELAADERNAITDGPFGSKLKTEHYVAAGPRVVRLTNIGDGEFIDAKAHIAEAHFATLQKHRVFPGDLVIAALGENPPRSCLVPENLGDAIVKADCIRFKAGPRILPKFLNYVLNGPDLRRHAKAIVHGVGRPRLNLGEIKALPIPVPPLPEQSRIVAEIEKQFTRLDAGIAALRRTQANLKRYRAAVLKAACEGRLVPTEAELAKQQSKRGTIPQKNGKPGFESGVMLLERILTERRKNWQGRVYKEPIAPNAKDLGPLPEGWTWATFDQLAERVTVGFVGSMKHEYVESGVPFLRGQNVRENRFDPVGLLYVSPKFHEKLSKSALRPGDLAVVRSGAVGVTCVIPDTLPDSNCSDLVLVQRPLGFVPQYGAYYMNSLAKRHVAAGKVGVALTHFNTKSVAALAVPLPPLAEQTRIVTEVERRLSVVEELETVVNVNLQRATRLRQSVLQQAFSGSGRLEGAAKK